jgi:hypothetical protein
MLFEADGVIKAKPLLGALIHKGGYGALYEADGVSASKRIFAPV